MTAAPATASAPTGNAFSRRYGPWAVVTGASDGIGRAFAHDLAGAGVHCVLVARRRAELESLASTLRARAGIETRVIAADLATGDGVATLLRETARLDVGLLVAAAGYGTSGEFLASPASEELAMIDVNCRAVAALSHHFGRRFAERTSGGLVLLSSILAFSGVARSANYAATKAYVQALAEGLHGELAPAGIAVLAVAAGPTATGFARRANLQMGHAMPPEGVSRAALAALGRMTTVRPGLVTKLLDGSLRLVPRLVRSRILGVVMRGMTQHAADPRQ